MLTLRLLGGHVLEGVSLEVSNAQHAVYKKDDKYCLIPRSAIVCIEGDEQAASDLIRAAQESHESLDTLEPY